MTAVPPRAPIRILVADDHPLVRKGLRALLESLPDLEIVGEATQGEQAVALASELLPDVVIMDLNMPGVDGIEATRRIEARSPSVGVLVLTMYEDDESVFAAMRAGARGYLMKGAEQDEVVRAINSVAGGEAIFGPSVARRILHYFRLPPPATPVFPGSHGSRARGPRTGRRRASELGHRPPPFPQPEDGEQPCLEHLREAPGGGPSPSYRSGPARRPRQRGRLSSPLARAVPEPGGKGKHGTGSAHVLGVGRWCTNRPLALLGTGSWCTNRPLPHLTSVER